MPVLTTLDIAQINRAQEYFQPLFHIACPPYEPVDLNNDPLYVALYICDLMCDKEIIPGYRYWINDYDVSITFLLGSGEYESGFVNIIIPRTLEKYKNFSRNDALNHRISTPEKLRWQQLI